MPPSLIINIDVPNLAAAIEFYTAGLGGEIRRTLFRESVAELKLNDALVHLIETNEGSLPYPGARVFRRFGRHWTPVHLDVLVSDVDSALQRAVLAGAQSVGEVLNEPWGVVATLSDPFGHGLCLVQLTDAGYDSVAD